MSLFLLCRSNVLIDANFTAKLGDFGFSLEMPSVEPGKTIVTCPIAVFTQGYCAPEVAEGHCSTKSDVYSYGVVSYGSFNNVIGTRFESTLI